MTDYQVDILIYFVALIVFFGINLRILMALNIEKAFKKNKIWEIKAAYFLLALALAHVVAEMIVKITNIF